MSQRFSYFLVLLGAVLWGTTGTAQTFMPQTIHPLAVGASRLAVGGFTLLAVLLIMRKIDFRNWPWRPTIYAAISMAVFQYLFFSSVRLTGIAIGTVVTIGSAPVFSGFIEWFLLKRRPNGVWMIATLLAIVGCALLFINKDGIVVNPIGVTMSLGAGLLFAFYALVNKEVLEKTEAISAVAVIFSVSALMLLPFLLRFETEGLLTGSGIAVVIYLGIATTSVAYILFSTGLKHIPSSSAVTLSLAEPLTAALLSVVIVREKLDLTSWIGIAMLLGGILVLTLSGRKSKKSHVANE
ncbi:EamA family transporter [Sporosarcina sp. Marseille-Q4063]|uniref:DMT family transporter n=1 Tax=Sporosarcina sp. Marseille-Q4063 TaxID=2810514 RepID=UPI001BB090D0|nr:EamA family transporter [Sporosarcina sp. Marseille-Q4063]QUW20977.1 EamA family transporter [Sporosarcina sp. Marseille-Q4063]